MLEWCWFYNSRDIHFNCSLIYHPMDGFMNNYDNSIANTLGL